MAIAWSTENNLDDTLFYNRKEDLKFLTNILDSSQYGSTSTILLTDLMLGFSNYTNQDNFQKGYAIVLKCDF